MSSNHLMRAPAWLKRPAQPTPSGELPTAQAPAEPADLRDASLGASNEAPAAPQSPLGEPAGRAAEEAGEGEYTMEVLVDHGKLGRLGQIFAGTCGTRDSEGRWKIHPSYAGVCYLFDLMTDAEGLKAAAAQDPTFNALRDLDDQGVYVKVTQPSLRDLDAVRVTLLGLMEPGWISSYEQLLQGSGMGRDVAMSALALEKARVSRGVRRALAESRLPEWDVPVVFEGYASGQDARGAQGEPASMTQFMAACSKLTSSAQMHPDRGPMPKADLAPLEQALAADLVDHAGGIRLQLEGTMRVFAESETQASRVAQSLVELCRAPAMCRLLTLRPLGIRDYELDPPEDDWSDGQPGQSGF